MSTNRPNVIIVTTDQQRCDSLSCYGSTFTHTPNVDRLAREGAIFNRAYATNPVCTPARASIFSGQYMTRHSAWNVGMSLPEDTIMLSYRLTNLGYRTHYVGKVHFQAFEGDGTSIEGDKGWEETYANWNGPYYGFETVEMSLGHTNWGLKGHYGLWLQSQASNDEIDSYRIPHRLNDGESFGGEACDWDMPTRLHSSVWTADRAIAFLEGRDPSQPFFLAVGFQDPHHPHCVPRDYEDRVNPEAVPLPRFVDGELDDKPPHFQKAREGRLEQSRFRGAFYVAGQGPGADFRKVSEHDARNGRAYYHTMVRLIDREMGRIMSCLDEQGLTDNTIVIVTTDHGELLGDHGLWMKGPFHYEELVRIPFVVRWPRAIPAGQCIEGLISQVDIVPTLLAALGEAIPDDIEGVDALPLLTGATQSVRDHAIVECVDDPAGLRLKTIVTADRKLTYYHGETFGELYDLGNDPGELKNLWDDPRYARDKQDLMAALLDHAERLEARVRRMSYA